MESVNEGTTCYLTITFLDKNGNAVAPSSVTWEAIDLKTGTVMKSETGITPGATIEIAVPASVNAMHDAAMLEEIRRITIKASYGADDKVTGQYDYRVINLSRVG